MFFFNTEAAILDPIRIIVLWCLVMKKCLKTFHKTMLFSLQIDATWRWIVLRNNYKRLLIQFHIKSITSHPQSKQNKLICNPWRDVTETDVHLIRTNRISALSWDVCYFYGCLSHKWFKIKDRDLWCLGFSMFLFQSVSSAFCIVICDTGGILWERVSLV